MCRALGGVGLGYFSMQLADQIKIKPSFAFNIFEGVILLYAFLSLFLKQIASTNYMLYVICFVVLLICFIQRRGFFSRFFEKPVFALLSRYCLSVYLVQAIVIWDIFEFVYNKYPNYLKGHVFFTVFATLFLTCLAGFLVHHVIELPASRFLKKLLLINDVEARND